MVVYYGISEGRKPGIVRNKCEAAAWIWAFPRSGVSKMVSWILRGEDLPKRAKGIASKVPKLNMLFGQETGLVRLDTTPAQNVSCLGTGCHRMEN